MKHYAVSGMMVCLFAAMALGADIFVSPSGNDDAAGTQAAPLKTIAKARDKADELKASGPVTVYLLEGTYYQTQPLVFAAANSGTAAAPITYRGCGKAVISGGIKVTTNWTTHSGSIMKTTLPTGLKVDQLFLNGKRQIMARYPNYNASQVLQGSAGDALAKAGAAANPAEGPGYVRALHVSMWGGESYIITGKSGSSVNISWVGDNNRGSDMHSSYRMVENIYELLDASGEWFYRKSTGELFFWPPAGTNLSTATVELASLTEVVRFVGSTNSSAGSVKYITFDNVVFTHTYRSLFDGTGQFFELVTASDWGIVRKGTVFMQNAENITIKNCLFDQVGGNAIFVSGYNRSHVIINNDIEEAGASGVCLMGLRSSIRCPNAWPNKPSSYCSDRTPGPLTNEYPAYIKVQGNMMNQIGRFEKQTAGVNFSATEFDTIRHNTIHDIPRAGINFCDGCWGGHVIDWNWVYDCVKESGDHGPFNAWGRDRNLIYGQGDVAASLLDNRNPTVVFQNRFEIAAGHFGIDLDDQATNYYQEKNLMIGGGYKVQWTRYNKYLNGILYGGADVQFHGTWGPQSNHVGLRNIIYSNSATCLYQVCCGSNATQVAGTGTRWDSNVVFSTRGTPMISNWNGCGTQVNTWAQWQAAGLDKNSVVADPQFTDVGKTWRADYLPKGDFNPKPGSPAIALGFKPIVMDSFGVLGSSYGPSFTPCPNVSIAPIKDQKSIFSPLRVMYKAGMLTVVYNDAFEAVITTVSGRTLANFRGKGRSAYALNAQQLGYGTYLLVINTKKGTLSRRFVVGQ